MLNEKHQTTILIVEVPNLYNWDKKDRKNAKIKVKKYWLSPVMGGISSEEEFPMKPESYEDEAKARALIKNLLRWSVC